MGSPLIHRFDFVSRVDCCRLPRPAGLELLTEASVPQDASFRDCGKGSLIKSGDAVSCGRVNGEIDGIKVQLSVDSLELVRVRRFLLGSVSATSGLWMNEVFAPRFRAEVCGEVKRDGDRVRRGEFETTAKVVQFCRDSGSKQSRKTELSM